MGETQHADWLPFEVARHHQSRSWRPPFRINHACLGQVQHAMPCGGSARTERTARLRWRRRFQGIANLPPSITLPARTVSTTLKRLVRTGQGLQCAWSRWGVEPLALMRLRAFQKATRGSSESLGTFAGMCDSGSDVPA